MTNFRQYNVPTQTYGIIPVVQEAQLASEGVNVWRADAHGRTGYGAYPEMALVELLKLLETPGQELKPSPWPPVASIMPVGGPAFSPTLDQHVRKELPDVFWQYIRSTQKIMAIKELRNATDLTLKASKQIVDAIMGTLPSAPWPFKAADAPLGTVIRINGTIFDGEHHQSGYVFEKEELNQWATTGLEDEFTDHAVQEALVTRGFTILYTPKVKD